MGIKEKRRFNGTITNTGGYIKDDENSIRPEYREFLDTLFESLTIEIID